MNRKNDEGARSAREILNADVNAAYWKAIPKAFEADGIEDVGVTSCAIDKKGNGTKHSKMAQNA